MKEITEFKQKLVEYLTKSSDCYIKCENLIKFEFDSRFDFSFATSIWSFYLNQNNLDEFKNNILIFATNEQDIDENQAVERMIKASEQQQWPIKIQKASIVDGICEIHLDRSNLFRTILDLVAKDDFCRHNKIGKTISLAVDQEEKSSITKFRLHTLEKVLAKLIKLSQYSLIKEGNADINFMLTTRSNSKNNEDSNKFNSIVCGVVIDDKKCGKSQLSEDDFIKKRQEDMHLIAIHKYGLRVKNDSVRI